MMRVTVADHDDRPLRAVIVVVGQPETKEVLAALDGVQTMWDEDAAS